MRIGSYKTLSLGMTIHGIRDSTVERSLRSKPVMVLRKQRQVDDRL